MKYFLLKYWPVLFIVCLWFLFAHPYFLKGLAPFPSDYLVNNFAPWSAYPGYAGPVKNAATPDVITQIFPWKSLVIDIWKTGAVPLWNPYSFSGTPLLANYQSAVLSPLNLLYLVLPFVDAWSIQVLLQSLLAGIFMYIFVRSIKLSKESALLSSVAFMFCGFLTGWMAYGSLGYAILFLPLALFAVERFHETRKWHFAALLTLSIPLSIFSGHFQTSLYFLLFIIAYCSFKFLSTKDLKSYILNLTSIFLGLLLCAPQLFPSMEFYAEAVRSSAFIKTEIIPWTYIPTLFAPDFFGNSVTRNDWFGHYAEWNAYIGLAPILIAFFSLRKRVPKVYFFLSTAAISLFLAFQTPLQDLLFQIRVPVLSTSAASRIIVIFSFSAAVLAGFGLENLMSDIKNKKRTPLLIWIVCISFVFALLWLLALSGLFFPEDKYLIARSNLKLPTIILALVLFPVALTLFLKTKKLYIFIPIVIILITSFDVLRFATKWQTFQPKNLIYPEIPISNFVKNIPKDVRVFGNFGAEATNTLRMAGVEGYDPLYIQRYGEFLEASSDGLYHVPPRSGVSMSKTGEFTPQVINILGIKYFLHKKADDRRVWTFPIWEYPLNQFTNVYKDESYEVFANNQAFPKAFFVSDFKVVKGGQRILREMFSKSTDLRKTAILEEDPGLGGSLLDGNGIARVVTYLAGRVNISTTSSASALLFLSDPYYPGWRAQVDGVDTKIYRANYAFRAVVVPAGKHKVTFTYQPNSFTIGMITAGMGIIGTAGTSLYLWKTKSRS